MVVGGGRLGNLARGAGRVPRCSVSRLPQQLMRSYQTLSSDSTRKMRCYWNKFVSKMVVSSQFVYSLYLVRDGDWLVVVCFSSVSCRQRRADRSGDYPNVTFSWKRPARTVWIGVVLVWVCLSRRGGFRSGGIFHLSAVAFVPTNVWRRKADGALIDVPSIRCCCVRARWLVVVWFGSYHRLLCSRCRCWTYSLRPAPVCRGHHRRKCLSSTKALQSVHAQRETMHRR
jgi:hypothetical protein